MDKAKQLTPSEKIRINDLTDEILKKCNAPNKREEIFNKIAILVEGVKIGLSQPPTAT